MQLNDLFDIIGCLVVQQETKQVFIRTKFPKKYSYSFYYRWDSQGETNQSVNNICQIKYFYSYHCLFLLIKHPRHQPFILAKLENRLPLPKQVLLLLELCCLFTNNTVYHILAFWKKLRAIIKRLKWSLCRFNKTFSPMSARFFFMLTHSQRESSTFFFSHSLLPPPFVYICVLSYIQAPKRACLWRLLNDLDGVISASEPRAPTITLLSSITIKYCTEPFSLRCCEMMLFLLPYLALTLVRH